jgi:hypothetical protein
MECKILKPHLSKIVSLAICLVFGFSILIIGISLAQAQQDVTDSNHPQGYDGFQFDPPFDNKNHFDKKTLIKIQDGFNLFTEDTFGGNGRTCSTCHIPSAQYNLDPNDIKNLTPEEKALVLGGSNTDLEDSELVNKFALFNENANYGPGTEGNIDHPEGPFRASMPLLSNGLGLTTMNFQVCRNSNFTQCKLSLPANTGLDPNPEFPGCTAPIDPTNNIEECVETVPSLNAKPLSRIPNTNIDIDDGIREIMTGWSGNGALIDTSGIDINDPEANSQNCVDIINEFAADPTNLDLNLAAFALAAVKTHFTKTMDRVPGVDFICPTHDELIDISKFLEWLGRRYELDITKLNFVSDSANEGRDLFLDRDAGCSGCHVNAGANNSQGRLKQGPFNVIPPLTDDQVALSSAEYCPTTETCNINKPCRYSDSHCSSSDVTDGVCLRDSDNQPLLVDPLLVDLDELMPRSGMGANKTSRNGVQFLESLIDNQVEAVFPFDQGDGQLRSTPPQGGFNVQPAFAAAAKTNFNHNNAISGKIEDAIQRYFTTTFDNSQGGSAIKNDFRCGKSGPEALADLGGKEAIDKIGFFLRSLFSIYSISDCERFIDEAIFRINHEMSPELPLTNCGFELNALEAAFGGSNVNTITNNHVLKRASGIKKKLNNIIALYSKLSQYEIPQDNLLIGIKTKLRRISNTLVKMRHSIASTPEIVD